MRVRAYDPLNVGRTDIARLHDELDWRICQPLVQPSLCSGKTSATHDIPTQLQFALEPL